jgi:hypothetical protein
MTRGKITAIALVMLLLIFGSNAVLSRWVAAAPNEDQDRDKTIGQANGEGEEFEGPDYLRLRNEYIEMRRGIDPQRGLPDPRLRERAIDQMQRQELGLQSLFAASNNELNPSGPGGSWSPLGPAPLPNGNLGVPVSGRTTAIAVDPTNPNIVYLGAAQGGVWRSLDGGQTWVNIFDSADSLAIGAIAIAPSNPSIVYVGTGEPNQSGDSFFGVGLYRIDNANTSPSLVGPINPLVVSGSGGGAVTFNAFSGRSISKILVHPSDPATIFVSTATGVGGSGNPLSASTPPLALRGIFRSNNATAAAASITFTKLTVTTDSSVDSPATGNASVIDMVMEPGNPDNLVAAVIGRTGSFGGIYHTTNALSAATFTQKLTLSVGIRTGLAINKVGSTVTVYAATGETPTNTPGCTGNLSGAVRKSSDGGDTWGAQLTGGGGYCAGQCSYDIAIAVHPTNANLVYLGGQARGACADAMKKSTDGGVTFVRDDGNTLHPDSHALAFDATGNTIFTGSDGGVWKATVPGAGGTAWADLNLSPLDTLQFVGIGVHPFDRNIVIGGTQDNGTELQQTSGGSWSNTAGGDGGYALIDQSATDVTNVTMYHTFFFSGGSGGTQIRYQRASTVGGPWTNIGCTLGIPANGINCTDDVLFYAPMALGPGSPNTVYLGTDRLYRSSDRGSTHTVVSQAPIVSTVPISSVAISPQDDNYRVVGLRNGQIWATASGSSTLVNITSPAFPANPASPTNRFIGRVMFDPNNKDVVYVGMGYFAPAGQVVWKLTNFTAAVAAPASANWALAATGIPSVPVTAFAVDPANSASLFAGTDIGVFNSSDGGSTWFPYGTGLPRVAVFDMAIQNANRVLRVGTHGRGVWEISLSGGVAPSPTPTPTPPANDNFINAQVINGCGGTVAGTNLLSTKEPGEPNIAGDPGGKSVWYQWQAPLSASVTISTIGSNFDTLLGVYTGNSVSGLSLVADNDDIVLGVNQQSSVTFAAVAGTTYKIVVDGFGAAVGNIILNWQQTSCAASSLILENSTSNLAAVDSVTLVRGPFSLTDNYNFSFDQRRRIVFFSTDLGFSQTIQPSIDVVSVQIGGQSYSAESVGPNAVLGGSQIVFRLPDLAPGSYPLGLTVRGVPSTNSPNITIVATSPSSPGLILNLAKASFRKPGTLDQFLF